MKKFKIIKFKNGMGKEFYCVKRRRFLIFWTFLKFAKNVNITPFGNLTSEAYMFDSIERAESLINKINNGDINIIKNITIKKL